MEKTYRYYESPHREPDPRGNGDMIKLSWSAEKLEAAVRKQVASWPMSRFEGVRLVEDNGGPSPDEHVRLAEREFSRTVRAVASGYGNIHDLKEPLTDLDAARAAAAAPPGNDVDAATLREMALSEDIGTARPALLAVVERIAVGPKSVELFPKKATS